MPKSRPRKSEERDIPHGFGVQAPNAHYGETNQPRVRPRNPDQPMRVPGRGGDTLYSHSVGGLASPQSRARARERQKGIADRGARISAAKNRVRKKRKLRSDEVGR